MNGRNNIFKNMKFTFKALIDEMFEKYQITKQAEFLLQIR